MRHGLICSRASRPSRLSFFGPHGFQLRPAIVLAGAGRGDWILCQITSNAYGDSDAIAIADADVVNGSLRRSSYATGQALYRARQPCRSTNRHINNRKIHSHSRRGRANDRIGPSQKLTEARSFGVVGRRLLSLPILSILSKNCRQAVAHFSIFAASPCGSRMYFTLAPRSKSL